MAKGGKKVKRTEVMLCHHASSLRNRGPILKKVEELFPELSGEVLEVASGSGAHVEVFSEAFPQVTWQPTELQPTSLPGLQAVAAAAAAGNIREPITLDAEAPDTWAVPAGRFSLVFACNLTHISAYQATLGLISGAARVLCGGGSLLVYGPFKVGGNFTTESNAEFDASLKARDPSWGYRDVDDLQKHAEASGLAFRGKYEMPANNFLLHFVKSA